MTVNQEVYRDVLNQGYILHWYEVKSVLGRGAFGVTYLAQDKNLDRLVAIKEYFPHEFSSRDSGYTVHPTTGESREMFEWGLDRFIREAQTLAKFKHHNIVRVSSVFELNNTAYMVMEYEQGEELSKLYNRKDNLSEQMLLDIFLPILDGLKLVHDAGFIHRDIKPANIYLRDDGSPVLIDFGAARKTIGTPTRAITSLVTYGYAPFEQYNESDDKQGAWTDIYALGACLYLAVSGKLPIDALARGSSLLSYGIDPYEPVTVLKEGHYSSEFLFAIDNALMFHAHDRPHDVVVWIDILTGKIAAPSLPKKLFKPPGSLNDEGATVVTKKTRNRRELPADPADERIIVTKKLETNRGTNGSNSKIAALVFIVLSLLVVGAIVLYWEDGWQPDQAEENIEQKNQRQLTELLASAEKAIQSGKSLSLEDGAIYFYQKALTIDPENQQATNGIQEIIALYVDGIRSDLAEGIYDGKAQSNIRLLQAAVPDSTAVLALLEEIRIAKAGKPDFSQLHQQAEAELKAGRLISPQNKNALLIYRHILAKDPNNTAAKQGIEKILVHFVTLAEKNLATGDTVNVKLNINDILFVDPDSAAVDKLRDEIKSIESNNSIKTLESQQQQKIAELLSQAASAFESGNITRPADKNALTLYQSTLKLDKENIKAKRGIKNVESYLKSQFEKHLSAADFNSAESYVRTIERLMPKSRLARAVRAKWERKKPAPKPDIDVISEMIGQFKKAFETRDINALQDMSKFRANRQEFLLQFFSNYKAYKLEISGVKYIGSKRKGTAIIAIKDLINIQGMSVAPGTWSRFEIQIEKNTKAQWKIIW